MSDPATQRSAGIPEPSAPPVLGHAVAYLRDPFTFFAHSAQQGRIVRWNLLGRTVYQLNEPEDIEQVLVHNNECFIKGEFVQRTLGSINEQGLLVTEGDTWRRQRTLVNPAFHPDRLAEYATTMVQMTERTVDRWDDGDVRDVHDEMMKLTLEIVANALFGIDIRHRTTAIGDALEVIMARSETGFVDPVPRWLPTPANRRFRKAVSHVEAVVEEIIDERRHNPGTDVVSTLLDGGDEHERLSETEIKDQVMTLLLAGHETTALALSFTLYLLAQHPSVERRLRSEIETVLDGRAPTVDDLPELTYTEQVVTEAMRLYPPVHTIPREAAEPVNIAGHRFPEGTSLALQPWTVHRDPRFYADPYAFEPSRWSESFAESLPRFAYFPFGGGPRRCIGDRFAMMEAQLVLATLVGRVHLELRSAPSLTLKSTITTRPADPIAMRVHERSASATTERRTPASDERQRS